MTFDQYEDMLDRCMPDYEGRCEEARQVERARLVHQIEVNRRYDAMVRADEIEARGGPEYFPPTYSDYVPF